MKIPQFIGFLENLLCHKQTGVCIFPVLCPFRSHQTPSRSFNLAKCPCQVIAPKCRMPFKWISTQIRRRLNLQRQRDALDWTMTTTATINLSKFCCYFYCKSYNFWRCFSSSFYTHTSLAWNLRIQSLRAQNRLWRKIRLQIKP